jgi:eukaryotic-like serine/threonine-protein kinase
VLRQMQDDPEKRDRFIREIKVLARIQHPNIVGFFHATQLAGELVLATELVEGSTLADRMEVGRMPIHQALEYMDKVLAALECAHAQGVIHRDVTPGNIVITPEGDIKLTGFGLAKVLADPQLTQAGTILGSLYYLSPEQIQGLPTVDARTDIYAVGVILYELVTAMKPFEGLNQFELMFASVNTEPVPPRQLNSEVPEELSDVILAAMVKDPAKRLQSASEFRRRLGGIIQPGADRVEQASVPAPVPTGAVQGNSFDPAGVPASSQWSPAGMFWAAVLMFAFAVALFFVIVRLR